MGKIVFIKAGLFTTIQDQGRLGFVDKGIPTSGPMDASSFHLANLLARKNPGAACLEIYMGNVLLYFTENCQIVCTGANAKIKVDTKVYGTNEIINISAYSKVNIPSFRQGQWLYLAINGLFDSECIMGSQSFYQEITPLAKFRDNDILTFTSSSNFIPTDFSKVKPRGFSNSSQIPFFPGPSFSSLSKAQQHALTDSSLTLSPIQNRMGIQLVEKIKHSLPELISSPVYPGTVQLTQAGKIIILMKDAQVTGGYPRVLQLTSKGISMLSQLRPQTKFKFQLVTQIDFLT